MATKRSATATADAKQSPNDLVYMHHPGTGNVRAGKRRTLNVWQRRGWAEGVGKAKGLPDVPLVEGPVTIAEDGTVEVGQIGAADTATQTATAETARQG